MPLEAPVTKMCLDILVIAWSACDGAFLAAEARVHTLGQAWDMHWQPAVVQCCCELLLAIISHESPFTSV